MVTQKLISFKIDEDILYRLDNLIESLDGLDNTRINRNKFINYALEFVLSTAELQVEIIKPIRHLPNILR